jgi:tetratricopeptide (TPR) repeat protein
MAGNLTWFWEIRGYAPEARRRINEALRAAPADSPVRAQALFFSGRLALRLGDTAEAKPLLLEALSVARDQGDERVAINVMSHLAWEAEASGDPERATARHQEAVAAARTAGDDWALGVALNNCGSWLTRTDVQGGRELVEEALALRRRIGEPRAIALTAANLADYVLGAGELEYADALSGEALRASHQINYKVIIAGALATRTIISLLRDDLQSAGSQLREALETAREANDMEDFPTLLSVAGTMAAIQHQPITAATLWSASERISRGVIEEALAATRLRAQWKPRAHAATPNQAAWDGAWKAGAELSLDDALELALGATRSVRAQHS